MIIRLILTACVFFGVLALATAFLPAGGVHVHKWIVSYAMILAAALAVLAFRRVAE